MLLVVEAFITLFLLIIAYYKYSFTTWSKLNVPYVLPSIPWGNYPNPIIRTENWGEAVIRMYRDMKKKGHKYFGIYLFSQPCLVPTEPKYVRLFLAKEFGHFNFRNFYYNEKDDPVSAHLISLNGEKWRKLRTKMTPIFTTGKIKMVYKTFLECEKVLDKTLKHHSEQGTAFDVKEMFGSFSSDVIVNCAFGLEVDMFRKSEFSRHTKSAINFDITRCIVMYLGAAFPRFCHLLGFRQIVKSSGDFFIDVVGSTVDYREKNNYIRNDFLQLLISLRDQMRKDGQDFGIGEITAQCFIFFLAGFETSASTMSFALYEIAANPEIYETVTEEIRTILDKHNGALTYEAIKEMSYLEQIVLETLRLHSPVYSVSRSCTKDYYFEDGDITLKKGFSVLIPIRAIHTDPHLYPEPMKFKPERFHPSNRQNIDQYSYLPFGEGPRICIGQRFAIMEIKTALAMVLRNYKFTVSPRTKVPFKPITTTLLYDVQGGIWLNCEKL